MGSVLEVSGRFALHLTTEDNRFIDQGFVVNFNVGDKLHVDAKLDKGDIGNEEVGYIVQRDGEDESYCFLPKSLLGY